MRFLFYASISLIFYLVSLLPFWILYRLSDILFLILYYVIGYRKAVVRNNLANSFPEKTATERRDIEKKYFQFLADMIFETIKMQSISASELKKRFTLINIEEVTQYLKNHQSVLMAIGHYANWEYITQGCSLYFEQTAIIIYKPQSNKYFENIINKLRSRFGGVMVPMKQTFRIIMSEKKPFLALFGTDQTPVRDKSNFFINFLNQPTAVFLGIEKIAKKTGCPVIFCHIDRMKRGYHEVSFRTITEDPKATAEYEITKLHMAALEQVIRNKPEFWLWSHRRWKFEPEDSN